MQLEFESRLRCPSVGTLPKRGQAFYCTSKTLSPQSGKFGKNSWIPPCISRFCFGTARAIGLAPAQWN